MNVRVQTHNFNGKKLKTARIARGVTLEELGKLLNLSHQSVSKYENGKASPDYETLQRISGILEFTPSFFYSDNNNNLDPQTSHFFRSGAAVARKYKDQVKEKVRLLAYVIEFIESRIRLPEFKYPDFIANHTEFRQLDLSEIDSIAEQLRRYLGLGDGPISNITALCEKMGIVISSSKMDNEKIDACTVFYKNRPYILLNNERLSAVRLRFNIAHELGHILLHSRYTEKDINDKSKHKRIEQEANRFASSLLMPEATLVPELSSSGLDYLLLLKEHWKTSIQAIVYRAEELGIFTSDYALYLRQQISRKKWRQHEPLDDIIPIEKPMLFIQALNMIINKYNITIEEISFQIGLTIEDISLLGELVVEKPLSKPLDVENHNVVYLHNKNS
ncbi:helix-turn-helix domain-containing protein [Bacillus canaveralius]|nr:ImmA/IrrE family metallo-endopeptidase [Bacillus canaveralius]